VSRGEFIAIVGSCILFGPIMAIWPYEFAKWTETIDSIGRKPAGRVEPAKWNVRLTHVVGIFLIFAGSVMLYFELIA
jgi:hypothetical protein